MSRTIKFAKAGGPEVLEFLVHREGRDDINFVTNRQSAHILADRIDGARGLVTETCRKL